jgi:hypothetical protein
MTNDGTSWLNDNGLFGKRTNGTSWLNDNDPCREEDQWYQLVGQWSMSVRGPMVPVG